MDAATYKKMAMGQLTPAEVDAIIAERRELRNRSRRPKWMPAPLHKLGLGFLFVLASIGSSRRDQV